MRKLFAFIMTAFLITGVIAVGGIGTISSAAEADLAIPEVRTIALPIPEDRDTGATIADGHIYYLGQEGVVYQAPLDDPAKAMPVYQMPSGNDYSDDGFPIAWLTTVNETAILKYHIGGASMGTDYAVALYSDGSYEDLPGSYSNTVKTDDATIMLASDYRTLDLEIKRNNEKTFDPLGESGYSYGTYMLTDGQTTAHLVSSDLAVVGDEAYVIAAKWDESAQIMEPVGIYQVNINTNKTERVFSETATHFKVDSENIYFTDLDGLLYKAKLGSNQAEKVSEIKMNEFYIVGDSIYCTPYCPLNGSRPDQLIYKLGSIEPIAPGCVLEYAPMDSNSGEGYLACILYQLDSNPHKFKGLVINEAGGHILLDADDTQYITFYDGVIYQVVRAQDGIKLIIDGRQVSFSQADSLGVPFIQYDRTMVPLRKPLEAIGASVDYDTASRTVTIKKDDTEISIVVDGGMFVNGSSYHQIDAPAMIKDGRVYVPIHHVFEAFGYSLSWDSETKTVTINKTGSPIETVNGWSIPSPATGAAGLGMTDYIGVMTDFPSFSQYNNAVNLNDQEQINELNRIGVGLRNFSDDKSVWLNSLTFDYQVYKKENGTEQLVYQKLFSPFEGTLPAMSGTSTEMEISFWNTETIAPGEYTIKLTYPEFFTGINKDTKEEVKIPIAQNIFGETVNVTVNK